MLDVAFHAAGGELGLNEIGCEDGNRVLRLGSRRWSGVGRNLASREVATHEPLVAESALLRSANSEPLEQQGEASRKDNLILQLVLLDLFASDSAFLLAFQLVVQQEQSLLVRLWSANDSKHAFTSFIVGLLSDGNFGS
jgi:hypothetical protein